jgi:hypothetical protein
MLDKVIHNDIIIDFKPSKIYDSIFTRLEQLNLHSTTENEQLAFDIQDIVLDDLQDEFEYSAGYPSTNKIKELIQTVFEEFKEY